MTLGCYSLFSDFGRIWEALPNSLRRSALWLFFCIFIQAILEVAGILSISVLAICISGPQRLLNSHVYKIVAQFIPYLQILEDDPRFVALTVAACVALLMALKNMMFAYVSWSATKFGEDISLYTGDILFHQYLYSPYIWHLAGDSADVFQGLAWRKALAGMSTSLMEVYTYITITTALCLTVVIFTPIIILFVMLFFGIVAAVIYKLLRKHMESAGINAAEWGKKENKVTLNAMRGIRETLIYNQQPVFFEKFRNASIEGRKDRAFLNIAPPIPSWSLETAGFFVIFLSVYVMIYFENASMAKITAVVTIIMLTAWRILPLLNRSLSTLIAIKGSRHAANECLKRIEKVLNNPLEEPEKPDPGFSFKDKIELRNVTFDYLKTEPEKDPALETGLGKDTQINENPDNSEAKKEPSHCLKNISLVIPKGKRIALIGRSGAGKSTLSLLLSGLAQPDFGQILVDGEELKGGSLSAYKRSVGYVPQNPYIMGGTIAENVAFCQWGLPWDEKRVIKVCQMAEFEVAFTRGINANLGADGTGLSGGQAQRLSIARALYPDPSILIFDEATSALDTGIETAIMDTIYALPREITTITIAHRLDTVKRCDIIFWLEHGELIESGSVDEILPKYEEFLKKQHKLTEAKIIK